MPLLLVPVTLAAETLIHLPLLLPLPLGPGLVISLPVVSKSQPNIFPPMEYSSFSNRLPSLMNNNH